MKTSILFSAVMLAAGLSGVAGVQPELQPEPSVAVPQESAAQQQDPAHPFHQFSGVITEVSSQEKAITVSDRILGAQKMQVGGQTRIYRDNKNATWDDLKVGVMVDGTCRGTPGSMYVETLSIGI